MKYYRYEMRIKSGYPCRSTTDKWQGAFQICPRHYMSKFIHSLAPPSIFEKYGSSLSTRSWFTEYGYKKFGTLMEEALTKCVNACGPQFEWRLICAEDIHPCIMRGKVQVVELMNENTTTIFQEEKIYAS